MARTLLSDHGRLAAGALIGAITAALFAEGIMGGPAEGPGRDDRIAIRDDEPEPVRPDPMTTIPVTATSSAEPTTTTANTTTTTTSTTTTTTSKRPAPPPTTSTTVVVTTTRPTTTRPTTNTTTRTCTILC